MLYQMLTDKSIWEQVIGVPGDLTINPSCQRRERPPEEWQECTPEEVFRLICNNDEAEKP